MLCKNKQIETAPTTQTEKMYCTSKENGIICCNETQNTIKTTRTKEKYPYENSKHSVRYEHLEQIVNVNTSLSPIWIDMIEFYYEIAVCYHICYHNLRIASSMKHCVVK